MVDEHPDIEKTMEIPPVISNSGAPQSMEKTEILNTPSSSPVSFQADEALTQELMRRGVSASEISKLISLPQESMEPSKAAQIPGLQPVGPEDIHPQITFPPDHIASPSEKEQADRFLTSARLELRREHFQKAYDICFQALELTPGDPVVLEMLGDILQGLGRVDDAIASYHRGAEIEPHPATVEKKYGELMLMQNHPELIAAEEDIPRSPWLAVFFSSLLPGAGQFYNGETTKGLVITGLALILTLVLGWSPFGFSGTGRQLTGGLTFLLLFSSALYIYSMVDANVVAKRSRKRKSGWDV
jgi:TM2 domain-containing membrane protein YozV